MARRRGCRGKRHSQTSSRTPESGRTQTWLPTPASTIPPPSIDPLHKDEPTQTLSKGKQSADTCSGTSNHQEADLGNSATPLFDLMSNPVLCDMLVFSMDPASLVNLSRTCKAFEHVYTNAVARQWNIDHALSLYVKNPTLLRKKMRKYRAIIFGAFAHCFFHRQRRVVHLHIATSRIKGFSQFLINHEGYHKVPNPEFMEYTEDTDRIVHLKKDPSGKSPIYISLLKVGLGIHPFASVLTKAITTAQLNIITADQAISLFPTSSFLHEHSFLIKDIYCGESDEEINVGLRSVRRRDSRRLHRNNPHCGVGDSVEAMPMPTQLYESPEVIEFDDSEPDLPSNIGWGCDLIESHDYENRLIHARDANDPCLSLVEFSELRYVGDAKSWTLSFQERIPTRSLDISYCSFLVRKTQRRRRKWEPLVALEWWCEGYDYKHPSPTFVDKRFAHVVADWANGHVKSLQDLRYIWPSEWKRCQRRWRTQNAVTADSGDLQLSSYSDNWVSKAIARMLEPPATAEMIQAAIEERRHWRKPTKEEEARFLKEFYDAHNAALQKANQIFHVNLCSDRIDQDEGVQSDIQDLVQSSTPPPEPASTARISVAAGDEGIRRLDATVQQTYSATMQTFEQQIDMMEHDLRSLKAQDIPVDSEAAQTQKEAIFIQELALAEAKTRAELTLQDSFPISSGPFAGVKQALRKVVLDWLSECIWHIEAPHETARGGSAFLKTSNQFLVQLVQRHKSTVFQGRTLPSAAEMLMMFKVQPVAVLDPVGESERQTVDTCVGSGPWYTFFDKNASDGAPESSTIDEPQVSADDFPIIDASDWVEESHLDELQTENCTFDQHDTQLELDNTSIIPQDYIMDDQATYEEGFFEQPPLSPLQDYPPSIEQAEPQSEINVGETLDAFAESTNIGPPPTRLWAVRNIIDESPEEYLIDWEAVDGEEFDPTWEPKENVSEEAVREWEQQKKQTQDPATKLWNIRDIIGEDRRKYLIDWEDIDGTSFKPTWEPKKNANQEAVNAWKAKKEARKKRRRSRKSVGRRFSSKVKLLIS